MSSKNIYYYDTKSFLKGLKEKEEEINGVEVFFYVLTFLTYQKGGVAAAPLLVEPKRWPMQESPSLFQTPVVKLLLMKPTLTASVRVRL